MVITRTTAERINTPKIRVSLAYHLGVTEQWVSKLIAQNKDNGTLTTAAAIKIIKKETGLKESEILTEPVLQSKAQGTAA